MSFKAGRGVQPFFMRGGPAANSRGRPYRVRGAGVRLGSKVFSERVLTMSKKVLVVRAWVNGRDYSEYKHLTLEVNIAERRDAARDVSRAVKDGMSWEVKDSQARLAWLVDSGYRSTEYFKASDSTEVKLSWQADRDKGWNYWYAFCCDGVAMDTEAMAVLRRVCSVLEKAGAMGKWNTSPSDVWAALEGAGAVYVERNREVGLIASGVPDFLLPPAEENEVNEAA